MNKYFSIEAPAKLNLNLFVKKKYTNGLHFLESDICFLGLTDKIFFRFSNIDLFYQCNKEEELIIDPNNNLILQALKKFRNLTGWKKCFSIFLKKNIPIGAGLGGGSADAAATLVVLKKLFNFDTKENKITKNILYDIAKEIGSDIPACIESKDLKLRGYGDKIFRIKNPDNFYFLIIYPNIKLSTKDVFKYYEKNPI
jgi:4-diphosphocytidyl-2-C-methyl-D-erythritol kinase